MVGTSGMGEMCLLLDFERERDWELAVCGEAT
jgi:hypothetical protein